MSKRETEVNKAKQTKLLSILEHEVEYPSIHMSKISQKKRESNLSMQDCQSRGEIKAKLKRLFVGTIEQTLETEMEVHLGYEKHSIEGINNGNSPNGYNAKTIISDYGESEIAVLRDRNGEFEPRVLEKGQTRTDEIEQKILQCTQMA